MTDLSLRILLEAQDSASAVVQNLGKSIQQIASGNVLGGVAGIAATAAGALVGFGVSAVKAAGDFQQMTNTLVTSAGESAQNLDMVRKGILDISVSTATSTDQLTKAMYQIESSGQHGSNGLTVLKAAAQGAKAENADLEVVAKALTTVLTDYHMKASDSTSAMNGLIATVSAGKTTLQELSGSMGAVLPIASALGVSFPQVAGAMATMTNAGMSARQAAQNLAHVLLGLQSPNGVAVKSMQNVGLSAQQVKDALVHQGLPEALQLIEDHVGKKFPASSVDYQTALKNILGGQVGFKLAAMLTGQSLKDTEDHIRSVSAAMQQGGSAVAGFDVVQQSFNFRLEQAKQAWNALLIQVGTALLPVLTQIMGAVAPLITGFGDWLSKSNALGQGLSFLGTIIGNVWKYLNSDQFAGVIADFQTIGNQLGRMFGPVLAQLGPLLSAAFSAIGPILTGVVIPAIDTLAFWLGQTLEYLNENKPVLQLVGDVLLAIAAGITAALIPGLVAAGIAAVAAFGAWAVGAAAAAVATLIAAAPLILIGVIVGAVVLAIILAIQHWGEISKWLQDRWRDVSTFFSNLWQDILGFFGGVGQWFTDRFNEAKNGILGIFGNIGQWFSDRFTEAKNGAQTAIGNIGGWFHDRMGDIHSAVSSGATTTGNFLHGFGQGFVGTWQNIANGAVDAFKWMYAHNYYFQDLVDFAVAEWKFFQQLSVQVWSAITTFLTTTWTTVWTFLATTATNVWDAVSGAVVSVWNFLSSSATSVWGAISNAIGTATKTTDSATRSAWTSTTSWLTGVWRTISSIATSVWGAISSAIGTAVSSAVNFLVSAWASASNWLAGVWGKLVGFAQSAWAAISNVFSSAWNTYIVSPLNQLWTNFVNWFNGLIYAAGAWGHNMLVGFVNGILGMIGSVGNAVQRVAGQVAAFLGFHSPAKQGPGADLMNWGPGLVKGFSQGMLSALPTLNAAVAITAQQLTPLASSARGTGGTAGGGQVFNITINTGYLKDRTAVSNMVDVIVQEISRRTRQSGNMITWTSGGKS